MKEAPRVPAKLSNAPRGHYPHKPGTALKLRMHFFNVRAMNAYGSEAAAPILL